jgi:TonB family protein
VTESITTEAGRSASRAFPGFEERTRPLLAVEPAAAAFLARGSSVVESFRSLATRLRVLENERPLRTIAVVSAVAAEGKTLVSLGLASAFAGDGSRRVLLIEADLRQRRIRNYLGINPEPGLAEWLDRGERRVPVLRLFPGEFGLLAAGVAPCAPELLASPRMTMLVEAARQQFDVVLLDCAPLGPVADTLALQDLVDGFLFVVRSRHCPRQSVLRAGALLKPEKIVGTVLNDERLLLPTEDSYGYQYGYGSYRSQGRSDTHFVIEESSRTLAPIVPAPIAGGPGLGLATRPAGGIDVASPRAAVPAVVPGHVAREPIFASAAGLTITRDEASASRRRTRLAVLGLTLLVLIGAGAGYLGWRGRNVTPVPPPVEPARTTLSPETAAALERVKVLEERLKAIESEKAAAAAQAAEDARKKVEAQAAARGRKADPAVVARAQEQARRQAEAEQETRLREEQGRLLAEQRAAEERLAEERRKEEEARLAAAVPPPTTIAPPPVATPPPVTTPPVAVAPAPAPAPAVVPGALVSLNDPGVIAPVLERAVPPTYPPFAVRQRLEGTVQLRALVDETGSVVDAQIVAGARSRVGFDDAAVTNVKGRKYRPATVDGVPVKVWLPVRVEFKLP